MARREAAARLRAAAAPRQVAADHEQKVGVGWAPSSWADAHNLLGFRTSCAKKCPVGEGKEQGEGGGGRGRGRMGCRDGSAAAGDGRRG